MSLFCLYTKLKISARKNDIAQFPHFNCANLRGILLILSKYSNPE